MSLEDFDRYMEEYDAKIQLLLQRMLKAGQAMIPETKANIYLEFGKYQQKRISELFTDAIDTFYSAYQPFFYARTWSLYKVLELQPDEYGMVDWNDDDAMFTSSHVTSFERGGGSEGLYDLVFMRGFHGGASGTDKRGESRDVPSYRAPFPGSIPGLKKGYIRWSNPAVQSEPPHDLVMQNIKDAKPEIHSEFRKVVTKHAEILNVKWQERVNEIVHEMFG